ncbi:MAG: FemAB family PEP-CTERM system-associated protein [Deltaproteobacteria bacterium]|nr:FemAB family PEP-CTERM system-associated protein [Deltaproteobacteria bacterium]PWB62051.1 MAG: FemAB-like protein [Deltaproteobacteria bacterium]
MPIRPAGPNDAATIARYIDASDRSNLYHDYRWGAVVEASFGHPYHALLSENRGGNVNGILPLVHMKSFTFGNFLVSMPFFNYGGVCAEDESTRDLLVAEAVGMAKALKANHIEFRQDHPLDNGFPSRSHKVSMRLALPASVDELWKSFPSKLRSQVKVPQKAGMTFRIGREEEVDGFHAVFSENMRRLGTPVYPKKFFGNILERFPESSWIGTVCLGGAPVASGFLVGFKDRIEIPWASSLRKHNRLSPNMLLYWSCLKFACEKGYAVFDFGRSTPDESTYKFKEQWGARPTPMPWSYWVGNGGKLPDLSPRNRKYHLAIEIWKRLPLGVTRILGPRIVRNIP